MNKSYPLGKREEPLLDQWKPVYAAVRSFHSRSPWDYLGNEDLIAVVDPVSGVTCYCGVLGNGGQEFGMQVYLGDVGLRAFGKIISQESRSQNMIMDLRSIGLSFGDKEYLDKKDLSSIKNRIRSNKS